MSTPPLPVGTRVQLRPRVGEIVRVTETNIGRTLRPGCNPRKPEYDYREVYRYVVRWDETDGFESVHPSNVEEADE